MGSRYNITHNLNSGTIKTTLLLMYEITENKFLSEISKKYSL